MMKNRVVLLIFLCVASLFANTKIELWTMSQCPHGGRGTISLAQVKEELIDNSALSSEFDIQLHYVMKYDAENKQVKSLHGIEEINENIIQLVINEFYPEKFWEYVKIRNTHNFDTLWQKDAIICGLNPDDIKEKLKLHGSNLAMREVVYCDSSKVNASPILKIDGRIIDGWYGDYSTLYLIFKNLIENSEIELDDEMIAEFADIPQCIDDIDCPLFNEKQYSRCRDFKCEYIERPLVQLNIVIPDTFHSELTGKMFTVFREYFPQLYASFIDYDSDEGRKIVNQLGVTKLPAYYFESNVQEAQRFDMVRENLHTIRAGRKLYYLVDENSVDYSYLIKNDITNSEYQLFTMAECPYSAIVIDSLIAHNVNQDVEIRYIVSFDEKTKKISSLHGEEEIEETKRQLVIREYFDNKYWEYLALYNKNHDYLRCLNELDLDNEKLDQLIDSHGQTLLINEAELCKSLSVNASPTFLWNDHYVFLGADGIKKILDISVEVSGECK